MSNQFKRLFKHSAIYAIGTVAQSAVSFLLIPLYTRYIVPANYGRLEIINTFGSILLMLVSFGFGSAIMKTYFRDAKNEAERKRFTSAAFDNICFDLCIHSYFSASKMLLRLHSIIAGNCV